MSKLYRIFLDGKEIGTTALEKADAPMGCVFGQIFFDDIQSGYEFVKSYCIANDVEILFDHPNERSISTADIPGLLVLNDEGIGIEGVGGVTMAGMDSDTFEVEIAGISYPFYEEEFPQHVADDDNRFNKNEKQ